MVIRFIFALVLAQALVTPCFAGKVRVISHGERVDVMSYMEPGKMVLFDFYADWCGPCRSLAPHMEAIAEQHGDRVTVLKVDIVNWGSQVARDYNIRSIPHLKLFGADGQMMAQGSARAVLNQLSSQLGGEGVDLAMRPGSSRVKWVVLGAFLLAAFALASRWWSTQKSTSPEAEAVDHARERIRRYEADPNLQPVWFFEQSGALDGPHSVEDLRAMMLSRLITRETPVRRRTDEETIPLKDLFSG